MLENRVLLAMIDLLTKTDPTKGGRRAVFRPLLLFPIERLPKQAGLEPATRRLSWTPHRQSDRTETGTRRSDGQRSRPEAIQSGRGRDLNPRPRLAACSHHGLRTGSHRMFQMTQRRVAKRCFRYGRPYQQPVSLTVDRPLRLNETPAPFTSRSPGIATLGPSCTPDRQLDL